MPAHAWGHRLRGLTAFHRRTHAVLAVLAIVAAAVTGVLLWYLRTRLQPPVVQALNAHDTARVRSVVAGPASGDVTVTLGSLPAALHPVAAWTVCVDEPELRVGVRPPTACHTATTGHKSMVVHNVATGPHTVWVGLGPTADAPLTHVTSVPVAQWAVTGTWTAEAEGADTPAVLSRAPNQNTVWWTSPARPATAGTLVSDTEVHWASAWACHVLPENRMVCGDPTTTGNTTTYTLAPA